METETKIEISRETVLKRIAPGDKWEAVISPGTILPTLTDALEYYYQQTSQTEFFISARKGIVEVIKEVEVEVEKPVQKYSLYGED
jgi:hypothetical protein